MCSPKADSALNGFAQRGGRLGQMGLGLANYMKQRMNDVAVSRGQAPRFDLSSTTPQPPDTTGTKRKGATTVRTGA